jgi:hypothetical protein
MKISKSKFIIVLIICLFTLNIIHAAYSELSFESSPKYGGTFVKALGYMGLSIPTECLSARNPLLEPICLPDIPGGYCYHESCGKVSPVFIGKEYSIEVINP